MAGMSPRVPTTSPAIGIGYNAAIAYNSHIQYNQATTAGGAVNRVVATASALSRTPATATIKPR